MLKWAGSGLFCDIPVVAFVDSTALYLKAVPSAYIAVAPMLPVRPAIPGLLSHKRVIMLKASIASACDLKRRKLWRRLCGRVESGEAVCCIAFCLLKTTFNLQTDSGTLQ